KPSHMKSEPLVVERTYNAPSHLVWEALTDIAKIRQWTFDMDDFKPQVGFRFTFAGQDKGVNFDHLCEVKEVIPGKKLSYSWKYKGFEGDSLVCFELFAEGSKTRVKLTHTGLETFPAIESFKRSNFEGGWSEILGTFLKNFLDKEQVAH
ncbi:MAG TPA: SRPBCC domain-containing protein, partial [Chitinophagaceae bacterium]|nr:SRPBCC domain-containing protein [Chitinophagaceae bacterium]